MSLLSRTKERGWGVALRPGVTEVDVGRNVWDERSLLIGFNRRISRWFGGVTGSVLYKCILKPAQEWFMESPRLSTASVCSNEQSSPAIPPDCSTSLSASPRDGKRPVSLVSTLSSGSSRDGHSLYGSSAALEGTAPTSRDDVDLELSPAGGTEEQQQGQAEPGGLDPQPKRPLQRNSGHTSPSRADRTRQRPLSPFVAMAPNPKLTYLDRVVMEIIETERMYVRDLRSIVEDYLAHIIDMGDLPIQPEQVCALFGNIEDIYEFNSELLQDLDMCDNDPVAIARCFVLKSEYFEIYTQYCTNYPNSVAALTDCMRNKTLAKFFRDRQAALKCSLPLGSYLLKPVQRILKYHLLLQEIAKHFDPEEEGYEVVEEAIYTMTGVAWYINDMKRKHEHAVRLQEVQSLLINWKGPDLTTYGELVLEGTFRVHRAKNERTLFLFDRMLLITKKRGEHYVYKAHISCATLMLIESAKDCLCFSVTHYKHPKQPHTMQARTVEERKLWAHHIKRLILENHLIPQKAKEAIMEMDSKYPPKFRYSPERLKKSMSGQLDDVPTAGRQGRRQSEPCKQITKVTKAILKHADSEGALPADARCGQARGSVSTLGSSLGEPEAERPSVEEDEEDPGFRRDTYERLSPSDSEEPRPERAPGAGGAEQEQEEEEEGESDKDDILMEDTQDEEGNDILEENGINRQNSQSSGQEDTCDTMEGGSLIEQAPTEEPPSHNSIFQSSSTEKPEQDPLSNSEPAGPISSAPIGQETTESEADHGEDGEEMMEISPVPQQAESKASSSGEASTTEEEDEEEEDEEDTAAESNEPASILPPSVLDQASVIAERFTAGGRRGSLAGDEARSLGCPSPRLPSRRGSTFSLGGDAQRLNSASAEPPLGLLAPDTTLLGAELRVPSPGPDSPFEGDPHWKRDSTLSRQDRLLIGKIKSYYEHAEHRGASFAIKRRESLTYIPAGLVRNSVSRLNSIPKDGASPDPDSTFTPASDSDPEPDPALHSASSGDPSGDPTSHTEVIKGEESSYAEVKARVDPGVGNSHDASRTTAENEEFLPSSEMIRVWQEMEKEVAGARSVPPGPVKPREVPGTGRACKGMLRKDQLPRGASDTEHSRPPKAEAEPRTVGKEHVKDLKGRAVGLGQPAGLNPTRKPQEGSRAKKAPAPRVIRLGSDADEELLRHDEEKARNKVFQLARQYSQRIKSSKPMVRQRSQDSDILLSARNLPSVLEERPERDGKGKLNQGLPLTVYDQVIVRELGPAAQMRSPSPGRTPSSGCSPRVLSPSRPQCRSPVSPVPAESFNWPDVRELRSMYARRGPDGAAGRSRSMPERMGASSLGRRSSCSSCSSGTAPGGLSEAPAYRPHPPRDGAEGWARVCRAGSLDNRLSGLHLSHLQSMQSQVSGPGYYISGQAALPNNHRVIVVEKVAEPTPQVGGAGPKEAEAEGEGQTGIGAEPEPEKEDEDTDGSYVQIRSPTSREKISIMAVIDRCRAYQESDEYRQREGGGAKVELAKRCGWDKEQELSPPFSKKADDAQRAAAGKKTDSSQNGVVRNLREKFLNLGSNT
ncbi:pleckstrin homology domain-containing family G member 3-like isoform X2 [Megalops cyprinoides]|uniref:pleckstrin homology domain-containing family G member 3-like isoform X2 n=1 Tax=Megalops cyprinoides TaxID=118141 RepID=UPI0018646A7C|nr:pleckstrin homology domain-containing family G member 3-like isoform X2 [Megalops cyprinoides]